MALKSGHGGSVQVGTGTPVVVPVGRWEGNWRSRNTEVTQSDSGGCSLYFAVVQDNQYTFSVARDDTNYPEAVGFTIGTVIGTLWFKLGAGTKADKLTNSTVEEVNTITDNMGDVVRVNIRGHGGFLTPNQTIA